MNLRHFIMSFMVLPVCLFAADKGVQVESLQIASIVVPHLDIAVAQWAAGTGTQFGPISEKTWNVDCHGSNTKVTLRSASSVSNSPFIELVEVNPAIGPWKCQGEVASPPGFLVFAVDNLEESGAVMESTGMKKVASAQCHIPVVPIHGKSPVAISGFSIYEGVEGILVKLITADLLSSEGDNEAGLAIGYISHVNLAVNNLNAVQKQLQEALSLRWAPPVTTKKVPYYFPCKDKTQNTDITLVTSIGQTPVIQLEQATPHLGVWEGVDKSYNYHVAYRIPSGTMAAVDAQMQSAGYTLNTYREVKGHGTVRAFYTTPSNIWIQVVDEAFDP